MLETNFKKSRVRRYEKDFSEESRSLSIFNYTCWLCGKNQPDCLHHILGGEFEEADSPLNAAPLHNQKCHIGRGHHFTDDETKKMLVKTYLYLISQWYRLSQKDKLFVDYVVKNKLISPMTVIDIGTRGGFSKYWQSFEGLIRLIGFEADAKECGKDRGINNFALHRDNKKHKFYITQSPASSSFYPFDRNFISRLRDEPLMQTVGEKKYKTRTLDSFNIYPDFIEMDTEGCELDILQSGVETLKSCIGLEVEVSFIQERIGSPLFADVDTFLREQGFNLYNMKLLKYPRKPLKHGIYKCALATPVGQIMAAHVVYFRDLISVIEKWSLDKVLKQSCLMDLYELPDCAVENLAELFKRRILDTRELMKLIDLSQCFEEVIEKMEGN